MVNLEREDRQKLILMLQVQTVMQDAESRRAILDLAGLQKVMPLLQISGASFVATSNIVNGLAEYGRISYENEALGLFLNAIKFQVGIEQQALIDEQLLKYKMMEPVAPTPGVSEWKAPDTDATVLEKVFGENTLRPIAFLERGLEVARSVAFIRVRLPALAKAWTGTGFMLTPHLCMTNQHVVEEANQLAGVDLFFNYQQDFAGHDLEMKRYLAKPDGLFHANKALDYALFEVVGEPGVEWGHLPLGQSGITKGQRVNIIQHPGGQPKQISMQNNLVEYVGGNVLQYVTSTMLGSSGSPVFNDDWNVVGLHHAGGDLVEPTTGRTYNRNEGILMVKVLEDLPVDIRREIDKTV